MSWQPVKKIYACLDPIGRLKGWSFTPSASLQGEVDIEYLHERIAAPSWQPIATAPKDGTRVDIWVPSSSGGYRVPNCSWDFHHWLNGKPVGEKSWEQGSPDGPVANPSHWMPLPEPPK